MNSVASTPETPAPRPRRQIELRFFLAGREVGEAEFVDELRRQGGRAQVELVDLGGPETVTHRPTPAGLAALKRLGMRERPDPEAER